MLTKTPLYRRWKSTTATGLKKRRLDTLLQLTGCDLPQERPLRILEMGCSNGQDALRFLSDASRYALWGVDILPQEIQQDNFVFTQGDVETLPFDDNFFDLVISIGLLEHIEPMEKLGRVIQEASRVGRAYAHIMPCVATPIEPHTVRPFWTNRLHPKLVYQHAHDQILHLNFFSDHTWTRFEGFFDADVRRFWYLWPLVRNLIVYKRACL